MCRSAAPARQQMAALPHTAPHCPTLPHCPIVPRSPLPPKCPTAHRRAYRSGRPHSPPARRALATGAQGPTAQGCAASRCLMAQGHDAGPTVAHVLSPAKLEGGPERRQRAQGHRWLGRAREATVTEGPVAPPAIAHNGGASATMAGPAPPGHMRAWLCSHGPRPQEPVAHLVT